MSMIVAAMGGTLAASTPEPTTRTVDWQCAGHAGSSLSLSRQRGETGSYRLDQVIIGGRALTYPELGTIRAFVGQAARILEVRGICGDDGETLLISASLRGEEGARAQRLTMQWPLLYDGPGDHRYAD
ncbi:hypothetical protein [Sphingomicrobium arenosum]|uniref:hypothetical protein n=1 Tax=Sphingomicrobium arenosum TaxID=2233861 RepID=UPI0022406A42|nr:hypothetical protein [Sphingomicrobium arenosum]